jgi:hypothetical protein
MNDNTKSAIFVAAALIVVLVGWAVHRSGAPSDELAEFRNQPLFPDFSDPLKAADLEIIQYDETKGEAKPFRVALVKGRWCIPSHSDYPADAKGHMVEAATSIMGLVVLDVASQDRKDHSLYGVVDPGEPIEAGTKGVGTRVVLKDKEGQPLIGLVIGKEATGDAKDSGERKDYRYVRKIGEDPTYVVKLNPDKLSTNFADWIEKDLLQLNAWEIKNVAIQDYSFDLLTDPVRGLLVPKMEQRGRMALEYTDTGDQRWKLVEATLFQDRKPVPQKMADDEELNTKKLDDLKYALDDLKIVDVAKKPPLLSGDLRAQGKIKVEELTQAKFGSLFQTLVERGFYLIPRDETLELYSSEGEIRVTMKDGVEYLLRFGRIASTDTSSKPAAKDVPAKEGEKKEGEKKEGEKKEGEKKEDKPGPASVNRYLFVVAHFNPDVIEKPKLEPLPPEPKPETKTEAKPGDAKPDAKADAKPADAKSEAKKEEPKKDESKKDESKPDPKAERERIEKENKQKTDEYNKKIEEGKKKVQDLNARFADWYYIIGDDVYQKIHLGYKDIVQKKEKKDEGKKEEAKKEGEKPAPDTPGEFKDLSKAIPAAKPGEPAKPAPADQKPAMPAQPKPAEGKPAAEAGKPAGEAKAPAAPEKKPEPPAPPPAPPEKKPEAAKKPETPAPAKS